MRLLIDMNLSPDWVEHLEARGFDAVHWGAILTIDDLNVRVRVLPIDRGT